MSAGIFLVLSQPVAGGDAGYNAWYDEHLTEVLDLVGFESARRFRRTDAQLDSQGGLEGVAVKLPQPYAAVYDVAEGDVAGAAGRLNDRQPRLSVCEDFDGDSVVAAFFEQISSRRADTAAGEPAGKRRGVLLVMSEPVAEDREDEYNEWYDDTHLPEVLSLPGFTAATRYRLAPEQMAIHGGPARVAERFPRRYVALYEVLADDMTVPARSLKEHGAELTRGDAFAYDRTIAVVFDEVSRRGPALGGDLHD